MGNEIKVTKIYPPVLAGFARKVLYLFLKREISEKKLTKKTEKILTTLEESKVRLIQKKIHYLKHATLIGASVRLSVHFYSLVDEFAGFDSI